MTNHQSACLCHVMGLVALAGVVVAPASAPASCLPAGSSSSGSGSNGFAAGEQAYVPTLAVRGHRPTWLAAELLALAFREFLNLEVNVTRFGTGSLSDLNLECNGSLADVLLGEWPSASFCGEEKFEGYAGYVVERGIYFWVPANMSANLSNASYLDWYATHVQDQAVRAFFTPLPNVSAEKGACTGDWNMQHHLRSGRAWCNARGRFVPPHCESNGVVCGEVYHTGPGHLRGVIEALVVTHELPYVIAYVGAEEHRRLPEYGLPFIGYGSWPEKGKLPSGRVHFPVGAESCLPDGNFPGDPETPYPCDVQSLAPSKYASKAFTADFPAATLLLRRFELSQADIQELLELDDAAQAASGAMPSAACAYLRLHRSRFQSLLGNCTGGDQPLNKAGDDCRCYTGLLWSGSSCIACPPAHYCPGAEQAVPCGRPGGRAYARAGRRRRVRGPDRAEDCVCAPGSGYTAGSDTEDTSVAICETCNDGHFQSEWSSEPCWRMCPMNSWSGPNATSDDDCTCLANFYRSRTKPLACSPCPDAIVGSGSVVCNGRDDPKALPGFNVQLVRRISGYRSLHVARCPIEVACPGGGACIPGATGPSCSLCDKRHVRAHFLPHLCEDCGKYTVRDNAWRVILGLIAGTLYAGYFGWVFGKDSEKECHRIPMILKVLFHHGLVLWPVPAFPFWVRWVAPVSMLIGEVQFAQRCLFLAMGATTPPQVALLSCLSLIVYPAASLLLCLAVWMLQCHCKRKKIRALQKDLHKAVQILSFIDSLEDMQLQDPARMADIKREFKKFKDDVMDQSRIFRIWRTIYPSLTGQDGEELWLNQKWMTTSMFMKDSIGMLLCWYVMLHPFVTRDIFAGLTFFKLNGTGESVVFGSEMPYLGQAHLLYAVPIFLVFLLYTLGFPLLCFMVIYKLYGYQTMFKKINYRRYGFLTYSLELRTPAIYWEIVMIFQRAVITLTFMTAPWTSHLNIVTQKCTYVVILVAQVWQQPFDNASLKLCDRLIGCLCLMSILAVGYYQEELVWVTRGPDGKLTRSHGQVGDPADKGEEVHGKEPNAILCWGVFLLGSFFWFRVFRALFREAREEIAILHSKVHAEHQRVSQTIGRKFSRFGVQDRIAGVHVVDWEDIFNGRFDGWGYNWTSLLAIIYKKMLSVKDKQLKLRLANKSIKSGKQHYSMHGIEILESVRYSFRQRDAPPTGFMAGIMSGSFEATANWVQEEFGIAPSTTGAEWESAPVAPSSDTGASPFSLSSPRSWVNRGTTSAAPTRRHMLHNKNFVKVRVYCANERQALSYNMGQVIDVLLLIHKMDYIPFSVLSFVLADCIYWSTVGHRDEKSRRLEVFRFVSEHPSGKVKGLEDLFDGCTNAPMLSTSMRVMHLRKTAENLLHNRSNMDLAVVDVERYVRQLRFENKENLKQCMEAFSKAATLSFEFEKATDTQVTEHGTQTTFVSDQQVQTQPSAEKGVGTEYVMPAPTAGGQAKQKGPKELGAELKHFATLEAHMQRESVETREQAEVARREAELMREELAAIAEQQGQSMEALHARTSSNRTKAKATFHDDVLKDKETHPAPTPPGKKRHWMFASRGQPAA